MDYPFETVDVFTTVRFGGNPLAVITDACGLSSAQMQQIAAEFGYSETTFVLPPEDPEDTAVVRIFTPTSEVPFAGHPNVGTAFVLARHGQVFGRPVGAQMRFAEGAGVVAVDVLRTGDQVTGAAITAPQPLALGPEIPLETVAACVNLEANAILITRHRPRFVSVGLPFVMAELASREDLARAQPNVALFAEADRAHPFESLGFALFLYVPMRADGTELAARMFAPLDNVLEDPATGSASAALAAFRATLAQPGDGAHSSVIMQGEDMGRPSKIELVAHISGGQVSRVVVGGACVPVMRGTLTLA